MDIHEDTGSWPASWIRLCMLSAGLCALVLLLAGAPGNSASTEAASAKVLSSGAITSPDGGGDNNGGTVDGGTDGGICPTLTLVAPAPGEVVQADQVAFILARIDPPPQDAVEASIYAIRLATGDRIDIYQGDLRSFDLPDSLGRPWYLDGIPADVYEIHVEAAGSGGCPSMSATVTVVVHRPPTVHEIDAVSCQSVDGGTLVTLHALADNEEGDAIERYVWNPGDGTDPIEGGDTFSHLYPGDLSSANVLVEVDDARGSTAQAGVVLDLLACLINDPPPNSCGCDYMVIESRYRPNEGQVSYWTADFCAPAANQIPPGFCERTGGTCPGTQVPYHCKTGPVSPSEPAPLNPPAQLGWLFEIEVVLNRDTADPSKCSQGQLSRGTNKVAAPGIGTQVIPNPKAQKKPTGTDPHPSDADWDFNVVNDPTLVPEFADADPKKFGGDNYTAPFVWKRHFPSKLWFWIDQPQVAFRRPPVNFASQQSQFVPYATGPLGDCWCKIEIQHQWSAATGREKIGGGAPPTIVKKLAGKNCYINGE